MQVALDASKVECVEAAAAQQKMWEECSVESDEEIVNLDADDGEDDVAQFVDGQFVDDSTLPAAIVSDSDKDENSDEDQHEERSQPEDQPRENTTQTDVIGDEIPSMPNKKFVKKKRKVDGRTTRVDIDHAFKLKSVAHWKKIKAERVKTDGQLKHGTLSMMQEWVDTTSQGKYKLCDKAQIELWVKQCAASVLDRSRKRCRQAGSGQKVQNLEMELKLE